MNWTRKKKITIGYHILFWSMIWLLYAFFFSYNSNNLVYSIVFATLLIPITITISYFMVLNLIPRYLRRKKYAMFVIYTFLTLLFTAFYIITLLVLSITYIDNFNFESLPPMNKNYIYLITLVYLVVALVSFLSIWKENVKTIIENSELKNQLLITKFKLKEQELIYLKNQIHPHFLFNTLNTIYGLSIKKSNNTPNIVLKLTGLLDYILYQVSKPKVSLINEIIHLKQYVDLERVRFDNTLKVNFTEEIGNQDISIAPMLLLPFVENAFKHGNIINGYLNIIIHLSVTDKELCFSIKNTYKQTENKKGIGLLNIKDRLEILYPKNYDLQIDSDSYWFVVQLKLNHLYE